MAQGVVGTPGDGSGGNGATGKPPGQNPPPTGSNDLPPGLQRLVTEVIGPGVTPLGTGGLPSNDPNQLFADFMRAMGAGGFGGLLGGRGGGGGRGNPQNGPGTARRPGQGGMKRGKGGQQTGPGGTTGTGQPINPASPEDALQNQLQGLLNQDLSTPYTPEIDPAIQEKMDALFGKIGNLAESPLADLDPETKAQMDEILQARLGGAQADIESKNQSLLTKLWGSGAERSDVASRSAAMLAGESERSLQEIRSDDAANRINLRLQTREFALKSFGEQSNLLGQELQGQLQELGLQAEAVNQERNRRSQMLDNIFNRKNEMKMAQLNAQTQRAVANIQARTSQQNAMLSAYMGNLSRIQEGVLTREGFATDRYAADRNYQLGNRQISSNNDAATMAAIAAVIGAFASDESLKENIRKIQSLPVVEWDWRIDALRNFTTRGTVAQEVEKIFPEFVVEVSGKKLVDYQSLFVLQSQVIDALLKGELNNANG
jgi:hypothetical protein